MEREGEVPAGKEKLDRSVKLSRRKMALWRGGGEPLEEKEEREREDVAAIAFIGDARVRRRVAGLRVGSEPRGSARAIHC